MTTHKPVGSRSASSRVTTRDLLPLAGYVVPTVLMAYGLVMPRHGITGLNELTLGFAGAVFGAAVTYVVGLHAALARRTAPAAASWQRPEWIARQSARPRGLVGWCLGLIMRAETAPANDLVVRSANIEPDAEVLDVGCGPGYAVQRVAERLVSGHVIGLDASHTMVRQAARRNRRFIATGRAEIVEGTADRIPYPAARFDHVLATHVVYFWTDLSAVARELRRVLKATGVLTLALSSADDMQAAFPATVYTLRPPEDIRRVFSTAGFGEAEVDMRQIGTGRLVLMRLRAQPALDDA